MIHIFGDIFLNKKYYIDIDIDIEDYIFNLEHPISSSKNFAKNKVLLSSEKSFIYDSFKKNPIAVCLSNNNIFDLGDEGFIDTIDFLKSNNIGFFGAGSEKDNFNNPFTYKIKNTTYDFYGYCCLSTKPNLNTLKNTVSKIDLNRIKNDIRKSKLKGHNAIIQLHWGDEEITIPKPSDVKVARKIIELGAELVIGHHSHVVQSHEIFRDKFIFYGLGNFIFPDLNIPSYFDGKKFTKTYKKIQSKRNTIGLMVIINDDKKITYNSSILKKNKVSLYNFNLFKTFISNIYLYKIYCFLTLRKRSIESFISNPKKPTLNQILYFLGLRK
jgi:hypothetical protein